MLVGLNANIDVLAMYDRPDIHWFKRVCSNVDTSRLSQGYQEWNRCAGFQNKTEVDSECDETNDPQTLPLSVFVCSYGVQDGSALFAKPRISGDWKYCFVDTRRYMER